MLVILKTTPIRYIIAHSLNIQSKYIKSQPILQYYTENLSQEENTCVSLISHQQPYNNFLLCFIAEDEQKIDWGGRWTLNVILNTEMNAGPKPILFEGWVFNFCHLFHERMIFPGYDFDIFRLWWSVVLWWRNIMLINKPWCYSLLTFRTFWSILGIFNRCSAS